MRRWARRLVWLGMLAAVTAATARWWSARSVPAPSHTPAWPPFEPPAPGPRPVIVPQVSDEPLPVTGLASDVAPTDDDIAGSAWVAPVEGDCPLDHPVKANDNSGIYHLPGGRFYERTRAERCYVDAESAAADGYRAAKA